MELLKIFKISFLSQIGELSLLTQVAFAEATEWERGMHQGTIRSQLAGRKMIGFL